jgi:hypothetical protein
LLDLQQPYNQEHKVIGAVVIVWLLDLQQPYNQEHKVIGAVMIVW